MKPHPVDDRPSWQRTVMFYLSPHSLRMLALGFAAGLPLLLVLGTLGFRLREAGIDRATIGFLSWVGLAYGIKWTWAPLVDRLALPWLTARLGRRRSWLILSQLLIILGLSGMALSDPQDSLQVLIACAVLVAFGSATQDIALDAFRIESAAAQWQAALAASYQTGYRLAMIWAGAGVLWLASWANDPSLPAHLYQHQGWQLAYSVMAASMFVGLFTVALSPEPAAAVTHAPSRNLTQWLRSALVEPLQDFLQRYGWYAVLVLSLIATYRISDIVMGIMANPFYVDMGYSKDEVATVTKLYGVLMTLLGAFIGGVLVQRVGLMRVLMAGAVLSAWSNLLFAWLATQGHQVSLLTLVVSVDNLSAGLASAAFIAYLSSLTNVTYSATQYALFSSLMLLLPKFLAGFSGVSVNHVGYVWFFIGTAALGLPVLLLLWLHQRLLQRIHTRSSTDLGTRAVTPDSSS